MALINKLFRAPALHAPCCFSSKLIRAPAPNGTVDVPVLYKLGGRLRQRLHRGTQLPMLPLLLLLLVCIVVLVSLLGVVVVVVVVVLLLVLVLSVVLILVVSISVSIRVMVIRRLTA